MGGGGVAKPVERTVGDACFAHRGLEDAASVVVGVDPVPASLTKRGAGRCPGPGLALVPEPLCELRSDRDPAAAVSGLGCADALVVAAVDVDEAAAVVDVADVEADELGDAEAGDEEEVDEQQVVVFGEGGSESVDLLEGERLRFRLG